MNTRISPTLGIPETSDIPRHVAIIMDGNGRWARARYLPRVAGHKRGVEAVRRAVQACIAQGVSYLTLFAFSSENWRRPEAEVSFLMSLFAQVLQREIEKLHTNGVRLRIVGDRNGFDARLQKLIEQGERSTADNTRLNLTIAANYGGRWDVLQALQRLLAEHPELNAQPQFLDETRLAPYLQMAFAPEPDLFIRTGGEQRISNFLLWQLAYTELYFTERLWPEFDADMLSEAISSYQQRERRFGRTSAQLDTTKAGIFPVPHQQCS